MNLNWKCYSRVHWPPYIIRFWIDCDGRYGTHKKWKRDLLNGGRHDDVLIKENIQHTNTIEPWHWPAIDGKSFVLHPRHSSYGNEIRRQKRDGRLQLDHKYSEIGADERGRIIASSTIDDENKRFPSRFFKTFKTTFGRGTSSSRMFYRGFSTIGHVLNL